MRILTLVASLAFLAGNAAGAEGDAARGEQLYARCAACHALGYDRVGPRHCDLVGRRAGSVPGFEYSPAMKESRLLWTRENLSRFLANPTGVVPGTTMTYAGVDDAKDRADLIAYLGKAACGSRQPTEPLGGAGRGILHFVELARKSAEVMDGPRLRDGGRHQRACSGRYQILVMDPVKRCQVVSREAAPDLLQSLCSRPHG